MKNLFVATTDITCKLDEELDYDNLHSDFNNKKIIVKIIDYIIEKHIKISEKVSTKKFEEIKIKNLKRIFKERSTHLVW